MAVLANSAAASRHSLADVFGDRPAPPLKLHALFEPAEAAPGESVRLYLQGIIPKGSYIYSVHPQGDGGPHPTAIELPSPHLAKDGPLEESDPLEVFDPPFGRVLRIHREVFSLWQPFRLNAATPPGDYRMEGLLLYNICDGKVCSTLKKVAFQAELRVKAGS